MYRKQENWLTRLSQTMGGGGEGGTAYSCPGGLGRLMGGPFADFKRSPKKRRRRRHVIHKKKLDKAHRGSSEPTTRPVPEVRKTDPRGHMPD